jgi:hypothetical protein
LKDAAVPVNWMIDSRLRLVVVTAEGTVTRAEMEDYVEVVAAARANGYAKIYDGTQSKSGMTREEMLILAARFRQLHAEPHGPLAIVLQAERQADLRPVLGALAAADRPLRLFTDFLAAQRWIDAQRTQL